MIIVDKHASTYDDNGNPTYDDNGNLTFDGNFKYTYDAWNRLVKATLDDTDVTIHEAAFDGLGRRVVKTVSNSGDLDGVTEYYHNRNQIIETRDGSGNLEMQVYHELQNPGDCPRLFYGVIRRTNWAKSARSTSRSESRSAIANSSAVQLGDGSLPGPFKQEVRNSKSIRSTSPSPSKSPETSEL